MRSCNFDEAVKVLRAGDPLIFPTDTVVAVGVAVCAADDAHVLSDIKQRDPSKPVSWLVDSLDSLDTFGKEVPEYVHVLAKRYWPGALTFVIRASDSVPPDYRSKEGTIGLRMPTLDSSLQLIEAVGCPIAATSANEAGHPAPSRLEEVSEALLFKAPIYDGRIPSALKCKTGKNAITSGNNSLGISSTVIDCTSDRPRLLREGTIRYSDILDVIDAQ